MPSRASRAAVAQRAVVARAAMSSAVAEVDVAPPRAPALAPAPPDGGAASKRPRAPRKPAIVAMPPAPDAGGADAGEGASAGSTAKRARVGKAATDGPAGGGAPPAAEMAPAATPSDAGDPAADADEQPTAKRPRVRAKKAPTPGAGGPEAPSGVVARAAPGPDQGSGGDDAPSAAPAAEPPPPPAEAIGEAGEPPAQAGGAPEADEPATSRPGHSPSRALVKARPPTRKEAALVARASRKLQAQERAGALTVLPPPASVPTILPAPKRPVRVTGLPVFAPTRPRGQRRSRVGGIIVAAVTLVVLVGALQAVRPFGGVRAQDQSLAPNGALLAIDAMSNSPNGPWDTAAGTGEALGFGGGAGPNVNAPGSAGQPVSGGGGGNEGIFKASPGQVFISSPPVSPWPPGDPFMEVPNHPAYSVRRPGDGYYWWAFGQCTWWAQYMRRDENMTYLGDARGWAYGAYDRGYRVGVIPAPGSTVVFRPGTEGAGGAGHVAHVEAVYPGGWFLISEMNFYWNGGGWGRVDYRFAHAGSGVAFIY